MGAQKCFRTLFEVGARSGRVQLRCQRARLAGLSLLHAAQPDGQKVDFFGQKSKKIPGFRKLKYGSGGPYWVSKSVSAHFLRSGRDLAGSPGSNVVPNVPFGGFEPAVCMPACTARVKKINFFRLNRKNTGYRKVKYGSGGPYRVSKSVSTHFLRSGRGLTGSNWVPSGMFWPV